MGMLREFCLPEKQVSLKVVFDHLKNWAVVGATLVLGSKSLNLGSGETLDKFAGIASLILGGGLALFLLVQALFMYDALTDQLAEEPRVGGLFNSPAFWKRALATVVTIVLGALVTGFCVAIFLVGSSTVGAMLAESTKNGP